MAQSRRTIEYLVADTTAFINTVQLNEYAKNVLTVPDVINEVRNKRQLRRLCVLPFDLQVREPRAESVKHCVEFAKKTGDYASLSGIDIKVISLTYELEADNVGTNHLRAEPVLSKVVASKEKPEEFQDNDKIAGWYNPRGESSSNESEDDDAKINKYETDNSGVDIVKKAIEQQLINPSENSGKGDALSQEELDILIEKLQSNESDDDACSADEISQAELDKLFEKLKCNEPEDDSCNILIPQKEDANNAETDCEDAEVDNADKESNHQSEPNTDDDNGWITPANIKKVKKSLEGKVESNFVPIVACMSTDYALQNVLKQMNLQICALDGRVIKHLRTYILRCYACYKTTSIMTKVFCPNCGNKTLKRVAVSLDENGKQVIHINTRRPLTAKYKNQSLPRFQGGKHSRNPILFEDQPIPRQMPSRVAKTKTNALDEDYIAGFSPFVMRDVDSKSAMLRSKGSLKEWARNNTFEEDRRKKHYNRVYK